MTVISNSTKTLLPFDQEYARFPESCTEAVFANDVALLMGLAMSLPAGPLKSAADRKYAASSAENCVGQFIETDARAHAAGLLNTTNVASMVFMNLAFLMMSRLQQMLDNGIIGVDLWNTARKAYNRLTGHLGTMTHDAF